MELSDGASDVIVELAQSRAMCDECGRAKREEWDRDAANIEQRRRDDRIALRIATSGMPKVLLTKPRPVMGDHPSTDEMLVAAREWLEPDSDAPPGLVLWGSKGNGKTVTAARVFAQRLATRTGFWRTGTAIARDLYAPDGSRERKEAEWLIQGRTMMVLDDFDKIRGTSFGQEAAFAMLDGLYAHGTPFILSMNTDPERLVRMWPTVGELIHDRLQDARQVHLTAPSYRGKGITRPQSLAA